MEDMKLAVLNKALGMLRVLGCQYAVVDYNGTKHGDLEVVPPKQKRKYSGIDYKQIYEPFVKEITPSDTIHELTVPDGISIESLRGTMCSWCTRKWGPETYTTQVKDGKILLMRYA